MRKISLITALLLLALGLAACGKSGTPDSPEAAEETGAASDESGVETEITLWTYPVGSWGNETTVSRMITDFCREYPEYKVKVDYLDYETGDARIEEAMEAGKLPDLVLEGPERLVANWGARGKMVDLSDLWESEEASEIYDTVKNACCGANGEYYEFPFCMTAHCMAINYDMFKKAGALQYIDEENHTWSTEGFVHAVEALRASGQEDVGIVYCGGQGGDQGTRALVNNLYSGSFTNEDHTEYTVNSEQNIRALELLRGLDGIRFDPEKQGGDEITSFCGGELAMAFCWNVSAEISQIVNNPNLDFEIFPMAFPTDNGEPTLQGGIWGFGIFNNGDDARIEASKKFIEYLSFDDAEYAQAVMTSSYWPVRDMPEIYANDEVMSEYGIFTQYMGDYYQVMPGWSDARTLWWSMLQKIGAGEDIPQSVKWFADEANKAAAKAAQ